MSGRELAELIQHRGGGLELREAMQILHNPYVTSELIEELAINRRLLTSYEMRRTIARHPRTAETSALRFVPGLYWRDLMELGLDVRVRPRVRRAADKYLLQRLPGLAAGEKIALARRAGTTILAQLRQDPDERVIAALLENPRLTEEGILPLAADHGARPQALDQVGAHERWRMRSRVRIALSLNPQTPLRVQQTILPGLRRHDLEQVLATPDLSSVVHRWAEQLLAGASAI